MNKLLFATTALIATASMAAAEVRISGYGRFGLDYNDGNSNDVNDPSYNGVSEFNITSRLRLQFDMSAETDGGVTLGARARAQAESRDNSPGGANFNGARFTVTYGGFTLGVGNIFGAIDNMPGLYMNNRTVGTGIDGAGFFSVVANVNDNFDNFDAYSSGGSGVNGFEVFYDAGNFGGQLSYSTRNDTLPSGGVPVVDANGDAIAGQFVTPPSAGSEGGDRTAINLYYNFGDWTAAIAYQDSDIDWEQKTIFTLQGEIGDFGVQFAYADNDGIDKYAIFGYLDIGASSSILAWVASEDAVSAADVAAGRNDNRDGVTGSNNYEGESYGIHYSYDLGGGASFEAGARESSNDNTTVQAGVYFSF